MPLKLRPKIKTRTKNIEHEQLISLINSMADAVIAVNEEVDTVLFNSAALNILDKNNIKTGTPLANIFRPIDKNNQHVNFKEIVQGVTLPITNRDLKYKYNDGSFINLYISIAPVRLGYGVHGQSGFVILLRDITREKSLEEERDEFISVVSHELRTPVTITEGNISNAQLIANKSNSPDEIKKALHAAHNQVIFLSEMINDLSTLSRAERGALHVEIENINIHELISELMNSYAQDVKNKKLHLKSVMDPKINNVFTSRLYLREILQNFLTNALKYTKHGEIVVHAENRDRGICLAVHDSGIGISKADQERVFDKFFRSADFRTREANGTGLGLYVTLKLANLIHGEITLDSELNKGSTFSIFVPNLK
ncbi:MAG TPA: ATP-binding protein [Patescibacteria group bacterium]|nr:ATP-binding protein [Patescibacteria group bacterium]